jgi:HD-GYP domain-containing protein (c-di-GMP phosphodiesterase class II)
LNIPRQTEEFTTHRSRVFYWRVGLLVVLLLVIAVAHWGLPTTPHALHAMHVVLRKLFIVPIVLAGAWFGIRGAVVAAAVSTVLYAPHVLLNWSGQTGENLNQAADIGLFWIVGILAGILFEREHLAMRSAEQAHHGTLEALASALDAREHETDRHSHRVADLAVRMGGQMGLTNREIRTLREAARLHDVGKIGIPDQVLLKPGAFNPTERQMMQEHAEIGSRIVGRLPSLREAAALILCHHERFDGSGYPRGLAGEAIPLPARIFAVADVYDALTNDRPYQQAMPHADAMVIIREDSGHAFDPTVLDVFERVVSQQASAPGTPTLGSRDTEAPATLEGLPE